MFSSVHLQQSRAANYSGFFIFCKILEPYFANLPGINYSAIIISVSALSAATLKRENFLYKKIYCAFLIFCAEETSRKYEG